MPGLTVCPACGVPVRALVFPTLFKPLARGSAGEALMVDGEASCFYHPQKKASVPCDRCGRFLCGLCDVELHGEHICPACLQAGQQKGKLEKLQHKRVLYDDIAVALGVWPLIPFFWFFTPITAPTALFIAIRNWNKPTSVVPRTKARFIVGIIGAVLQLVFGVAMITAMVIGARAGK